MTNENCYAKMDNVEGGSFEWCSKAGAGERTAKDKENEKNIMHLKSNKIKEIHLYVEITTKKPRTY